MGSVRERQRLSPEARRGVILDGAVSFVSRRGAGGTIRDLADELGISVGLIHRYFPSKQALIDAVYERVFASRIDPTWLEALSDERVALRDRLVAFYRSYVSAVDDPDWVRIGVLSGLDGSMLGRKYLDEHVSRIVAAVAAQVRGSGTQPAATARDVRRAWVLHAAIIFFLSQKHIHDVRWDMEEMISEAVDTFLWGSRGGESARPA